VNERRKDLVSHKASCSILFISIKLPGKLYSYMYTLLV
jgi:hypothetical protein